MAIQSRRSVYQIEKSVKAEGSIWYSSEKLTTQRFPWQDKAGGYGIQEPFGAKFIKKIDGDYYNVVGLPVSRLYHELNKVDAI